VGVVSDGPKPELGVYCSRYASWRPHTCIEL